MLLPELRCKIKYQMINQVFEEAIYNTSFPKLVRGQKKKSNNMKKVKVSASMNFDR